MKKVGVIDYGAANIENVLRAVRFLGQDVELISDPNQMQRCSHLILPGVGAFPFGMKQLAIAGFIDPLRKEVRTGKPILGICLGMQLLFEWSNEFEEITGLGLIKGSVSSLTADFTQGTEKVPRIGWHTVTVNEPGNLQEWHGKFFYFAHSFYAKPIGNFSQLVTSFGANQICAGFRDNNLVGVQFHPEKSGVNGLSFLNTFFST